MKPGARLIIGPRHCDFLELDFQQTCEESPGELLESVRLSQTRLRTVWCRGGMGFIAGSPLSLEFVQGRNEAEGINDRRWGLSGAKQVGNLCP
jgi:hypothetical protein